MPASRSHPFVCIRKIVYRKPDLASSAIHPCSPLHTRIIDRLTCCEYLFDYKLPPPSTPPRYCLPCLLYLFSRYIIIFTTLCRQPCWRWWWCHTKGDCGWDSTRLDSCRLSPFSDSHSLNGGFEKINWIFFIYSKQTIRGLLFIFNFVVNSCRHRQHRNKMSFPVNTPIDDFSHTHSFVAIAAFSSLFANLLFIPSRCKLFLIMFRLSSCCWWKERIRRGRGSFEVSPREMRFSWWQFSRFLYLRPIGMTENEILGMCFKCSVSSADCLFPPSFKIRSR